MSSYRFPLQKLLDVKQKEKEQAMGHYSEALHQVSLVQEELLMLQQEKNVIQNEMKNHRSGSIYTFVSYENYMSHLEKKILKTRRNLVHYQNLASERQQILQECSKEEKVWSNLKERSFAEYVSDMRRQEQYEFDDIANQQYRRNVEGLR